MLKERFKLKIGVFLVLIKDSQVLLLRRYNTGIADGLHVVPMGGLEEGETIQEALVREMGEEIGIQIDDLKLAHVLHRNYTPPNSNPFTQVDLFFVAGSYRGEIQNKEPHKCDELKFYPLDHLPATTEPFIKQALSCIQKGILYSEIGWQPTQALSPTIYESSAKTYDSFRNADPVLTDMIGKHFKHKGRFLDICCGSGNYTIALKNRGFDFEGVDLSPSMLNKAQIKAPDMVWTRGDMQSLPFEPSSYDGALTMNSLHYVPESLVEVFQEMKRILKPGSPLVVFAIGLEQCLQFWLGHYFPYFWDIGQKVLIPSDALVEALQKAGFESVQKEPFFVSEQTTDLFTYACKYRPQLFLNPEIRAGMTPLQLPEYAEEVKAGCIHLQQDIESGAIYEIISQYESNLGEGFIFSAKAPNP